MKLSVVIGVIQMSVGIILRGVNSLYFGEKVCIVNLPSLVSCSVMVRKSQSA